MIKLDFCPTIGSASNYGDCLCLGPDGLQYRSVGGHWQGPPVLMGIPQRLYAIVDIGGLPECGCAYTTEGKAQEEIEGALQFGFNRIIELERCGVAQADYALCSDALEDLNEKYSMLISLCFAWAALSDSGPPRARSRYRFWYRKCAEKMYLPDQSFGASHARGAGGMRVVKAITHAALPAQPSGNPGELAAQPGAQKEK